MSHTRCIDGRLMRSDPQRDDPYLETDIGQCPECNGTGRNCWDCGASHATEHWDQRPYENRTLHLCDTCAEKRRSVWMRYSG